MRSQVTGLPVAVNVTSSGPTDELTVNALGGEDRSGAVGLAAGVVALRADGGDGADDIIGGPGDTVVGGDDIFDGGDGDDVLVGGLGSDILINGEVVIQ